MLSPWKKSYDQPREHIKKQKHYFANKFCSSQSYGFSSSQIWMWELGPQTTLRTASLNKGFVFICVYIKKKSRKKESWALKNLCFWIVVLEKTLESPLDCKEIKPVHPKGNQSWIFVGRTDAEAETSILWPPDAKNWLTGKDSEAGKDWGQEEKGMTEDEMVGWHHQLDGHEFE